MFWYSTIHVRPRFFSRWQQNDVFGKFMMSAMALSQMAHFGLVDLLRVYSCDVRKCRPIRHKGTWERILGKTWGHQRKEQAVLISNHSPSTLLSYPDQSVQWCMVDHTIVSLLLFGTGAVGFCRSISYDEYAIRALCKRYIMHNHHMKYSTTNHIYI